MPDHRNPLSVRVFPGILLIQAVDIRQDHQQVRLHDIRHNSGKGVVIPEILAVQLVDGYGVVLINYRDDPHFHQGLKGVDHVLFAVVMLHHVPGQKNLGHGAVVFPEQLVIDKHQLALAYRRHRLLFPSLLRPLLQTQLSYSHADGAGADQDHLPAGILQIAQHLAQVVDSADIQPSAVIGQSGGSHLDYNSLRFHHTPPIAS